jgi:SAM-dependent methyltransferase
MVLAIRPNLGAFEVNNFTGTEFRDKAAGFDKPTRLPQDDVQRTQWQKANKAWWESTPMRYDWRKPLVELPGSKEYFAEIDQRFLASAEKYLPSKNLPFDRLIPFDELHDKDVLEIGVGHGTHAQLIAPHCKSFTGIDLTRRAVEMTSKRFELCKLTGNILEMDAERMSFPDDSFDFIWTWGVIHHSADTRQVLREMRRVLRPTGNSVVMVYHRSWWNYWFVSGVLKGVLQGSLRRHGSVHGVSQAETDGAIARYYTPVEWREATESLFKIDAIQIFGLKAEVVPIPPGRFKSLAEFALPDAAARLLTNRLQMGSFLVAHMHKV